ncbi:MAG TPA: alpha/beta fold hydrolase [Solirubrobacteraceae bacterium]|nr:alpha/beta fold hydrolase [Solirubrobacteraceae bacterium]
MASARLIAEMLMRRGRTVAYGPDPSQCADLNLPHAPGPHPVMVLLHGGSWRSQYGKRVMRGLVGDLLARGWATWNVEYRRVGNGGGWPETFLDVAGAIDHLPQLDAALDLDRVSLLGHSAGGHLALWAASRERLAPGAPGRLEGQPRVRLRAVISQAGVCDLSASARRVPGGAAAALMGGGPDDLPERYDAADPMRLLPPSAPVLLVHGTADQTVSVDYSRSYAQAARASGDEVELVEIAGEAGSHRAHIDPRGEAWAAVTRRLPDVRA